jgi:GTPase
MFTDEVQIRVCAGDGGPGCLSFRREKFAPKGGPDGGDGGDGGSVFLRVEPGETSLYHLKGFAEFSAQKGKPGSPRNMTGGAGKDLTLVVPQGTLVYDAERGNLLADLDDRDSVVAVVRGGKGGYGNKHYATAINRTPRRHEPGTPGEVRELKLVLKLIADVGLVGLPNAGKSTLLSVVSAARPKVAAYPFTTLEPGLGIVEIGHQRHFVMADIPGLIEGASSGKGLGHKFLRHIERTRVLLLLVDCSDTADTEPAEALRVVRDELSGYSEKLADLPWLVAATKVETESAGERARALEAAIGRDVHAFSAVTHQGLDELLKRLLPLLEPRLD